MLKNNENDTITFQNQSQIALARAAVEDKRVELVPNISAFIVQSINQKTYSVQLFPKEKCNFLQL